MAPMRIAIAGASGRMGRMLIEATTRDSAAVLVAALDRSLMQPPSERTQGLFSASGPECRSALMPMRRLPARTS
jgi:dihydrodipicolinate reductase